MASPYDGQLGTAHDGTPVVWVASLGRAVPVSAAKSMGVTPRPAGAPGGVGGAQGYDSAAASPAYQTRMAQARAAADLKHMTEATASQNEGYGNKQTALGAEALLADDTPTGLFAKQRIAAGKVLGGTLGGVLGIPTTKQTANLENLQMLGNQGTLGQVKLLHGPLSDRDVMFLKTLQYDPGASRLQNQRVVAAQKWAADRQVAYGAAVRAWTKQLGSPTALNPSGVSFEQWWGEYAEKKLPRPGTTVATPRDQANQSLKAKSAKATGQAVLLGIEP
jgi:hypothetical protein